MPGHTYIHMYVPLSNKLHCLPGFLTLARIPCTSSHNLDFLLLLLLLLLLLAPWNPCMLDTEGKFIHCSAAYHSFTQRPFYLPNLLTMHIEAEPSDSVLKTMGLRLLLCTFYSRPFISTELWTKLLLTRKPSRCAANGSLGSHCLSRDCSRSYQSGGV